MLIQPNIVFVITDDQGFGDMGCHGNPWISTPNIDSFHDDSIRLTNFHAGPTCAPTRASLMTGHHANSTGVWHTVGGRSLLRKNEVTIADALKTAGYRTGLFGKWHLGDNAPYRPQDRGFDRVVTHGGGGIGQAPDWWGNDYWDDTYLSDGVPEKFSGYCTDVWFDEAEKFIRDSVNEPFFCYLAPNAPHEPYNIMEEWRAPYRERLDVAQPEADRRERFYGMISHLDNRFGQLRNLLSELSLEDNTILVFMTDNGTSCGASFGQNGELIDGWNAGLRGVKNSEYDGGHRVPVFMSWPNGFSDSSRDVIKTTGVVDMMPTLLDLCGVEHSLTFHGRSILPLLGPDNGNWLDRVLVTDSQRVPEPIKWRKSAAMTDRWRLVNGTELYDILKDRGQTRNIAQEYPEIVDRLRAAYEEWWQLVQPDFNDDIPISIGLNGDTVNLSSHDWRAQDEDLVWNQGQVREGLRRNGYWELDAASSGTYEFRLYRWPEDGCGKPLCKAIPESEDDWNPGIVEPVLLDWFSGSVPLPIISAEIHLTHPDGTNNTFQSLQVSSDQTYVSFSATLPAGPIHLKTVFNLNNPVDDGEPSQTGAYYVKVIPQGRFSI